MVLLDYRAISSITGLAPSTLRKYRSQGLLPEPDDQTFADRPRWAPVTIATWMDNRPGRGAPGRPRRRRVAS